MPSFIGTQRAPTCGAHPAVQKQAARGGSGCRGCPKKNAVPPHPPIPTRPAGGQEGSFLNSSCEFLGPGLQTHFRGLQAAKVAMYMSGRALAAFETWAFEGRASPATSSGEPVPESLLRDVSLQLRGMLEKNFMSVAFHHHHPPLLWDKPLPGGTPPPTASSWYAQQTAKSETNCKSTARISRDRVRARVTIIPNPNWSWLG